MAKEKAVALVLREHRDRKQILVFRHPTEGIQMVKGNLDGSETPTDTARRELREESGLDDVVSVEPIGQWLSGAEGDLWHLVVCRLAADPPDKWDHFTHDGGGLTFSFFWHDLDQEPPDRWHPEFAQAFSQIRALVQPHSAAR